MMADGGQMPTVEGAKGEGQALEELNLNIAVWEQRRDPDSVERLDNCLSPELLFRRADGSLVGKRVFMDALRSPSPFSERDTRDVEVAIVGDRALVTATVLTKRPGESTVHRYRNIRVFFRSQGKWQLEIWFNDELPHLDG